MADGVNRSFPWQNHPGLEKQAARSLVEFDSKFAT